ncbi:putative holin-like toxin [Enterococcus mundtii]|nr:putative holin-like toxin [Enterococcus mundtii]
MLSVAEALALMIQFGSLMLLLVGIMLTISKSDKK